MPELKVYIVEDSPFVRKSLLKVIKEIPGVEIVGNGDSVKSAIEFLTSNKSDVCILDFNLPDGTGVDIIKEIKPKHSAAVYIVISNIVDDLLKKAILDKGADYFFDKSNEIDDLLELLEEFAEARK